jgi:hypothetical protein
MVSFQRPTGAVADLSELEYVSALQQTHSGAARKDGSIQDVDIQLFLKSRYGIDVSLEDVQRFILGGFGDGDVIDLSEMTSMLLIPTLVKAASQARGGESAEQDLFEQGILYPDPGLIQTVLGMILRDVTGSLEPPELTISLLQDILLAYGEEEMSQDQGLLREMLEAAVTEGEQLDANAFARALTKDVLLYDVKKEVALNTNYHDVMKAEDLQDKASKTDTDLSFADESQDDEEYLIEDDKQPEGQSEAPAKIRKFYSSPGIDYTACRYNSKFIVVLLWTGFIICYIAYFGPIVREGSAGVFQNLCDGSSFVFGCRIGVAIISWLFILGFLGGLGAAYVAFGSIGNDIESTKKWPRIFATMSVALWTYLFFFIFYKPEDYVNGVTYIYDEDGNIIGSEAIIEQGSTSYQSVVYYLALIIGSIVVLIEIYLMCGESIRKHCFNKESLVKLFTASGIKAETGNKQAAAFKMKLIVDNARQIHSYSEKDIDHGETSFSAGILNFSVRGEEFEEVGGFLWTWKRLFNKDLFEKDGIWISARLLAGNFAQLLISAFVLTYGIYFTGLVVEEWQKGKEEPARYLYLVLEWFNVLVPVEEFANNTCAFVTNIANGALNESAIVFLSFDNTTCETIAAAAVNRTLETVAGSLFPQEEYMVKTPVIVATAVAFAYTLTLVVVYIPSVTSTTLQFRSGGIGFFHDNTNFDLYRSRLDLDTILLGSMFWSAVYASGLAGILVGVVIFLFLWQATSTFFVNLLAILIALLCTIIIKVLISILLLRTAYVGFYRKKVNRVNIVSLVLECIMVGFSVGTTLARAVKLVLIACLYIGRVDTPLLARGVGVGPLMDRYPNIFRQDILALEAHRHPFVDLIGKLYLLKLRFGGRFANRAGYAYRLIFTVALLPWLRKHRVMARPELGGDDLPVDEMASRRVTLLPRSSILAKSVQAVNLEESTSYKV